MTTNPCRAERLCWRLRQSGIKIAPSQQLAGMAERGPSGSRCHCPPHQIRPVTSTDDKQTRNIPVSTGRVSAPGAAAVHGEQTVTKGRGGLQERREAHRWYCQRWEIRRTALLGGRHLLKSFLIEFGSEKHQFPSFSMSFEAASPQLLSQLISYSKRFLAEQSIGLFGFRSSAHQCLTLMTGYLGSGSTSSPKVVLATYALLTAT